MSDSTMFKPGQFCWWELSTTDTEKAKAFYGAIFGWTHRDLPIDETMTYTMLEKDGKEAAALAPMDPGKVAMGIPPHWMSYISVESADAVAAKATELNGTVLAGPFDVMEAGRMAVLQDPTGAVVAVWEPKNHHGAQHVYEPGGVVWNELATPNAPAAGEFYTNLFGYEAKSMPVGNTGSPTPESEVINYTILQQGEAQTAGIMPMEGEMWAGIPPHWMPYFAVANIGETVTVVNTAGGDVKVPPTPIPGIGTFAVIADPTGAHFSIIQMEMASEN